MQAVELAKKNKVIMTAMSDHLSLDKPRLMSAIVSLLA
jgi:hypothetical protein